jgi:amino acid transporter
VAGTAYASSDSIPDQVVTVNLKTGKTTPFIHNLQTAKGLVYLDASGNEPVLGTGPAATSTTGGDASPRVEEPDVKPSPSGQRHISGPPTDCRGSFECTGRRHMASIAGPTDAEQDRALGAPAPKPTAGALAGNAVGLPSVLFMIVTGAAPITAMLFNVPVAVSGAGSATPAAFLIATVALTVFSVGYVAMARRVTAAGGFYSFISHGLGQTVAAGAGLLIWLCYVAFTASVLGVCGYFAHSTLQDFFSINVNAWIIELVALALMSVLSWFHIELTAKVLGVCLSFEVVALLILGIAILVQGGAHGLSAAPFNPGAMFNNAAAVKVFGAAAAGVALFGAFWSWVGFEMAPNYAEESRRPKKLMGPATYISVIGLGVLYTFTAYMFVTGWGQTGSAQAVAAQFAGKTESAFYPLTGSYVGVTLTDAFKVLIITSSFACATAFYNTSARYTFSMARERVLPSRFALTHREHGSPHRASMLVSVLVLIWIVAFTASDSSDSAALLKLGTWVPLMGVLGILAVQTLASAAIIRYFLTEAREDWHWWRTFAAPLVGGAAMVGACYLLIANRGALSGAGSAFFIQAVPWAVLTAFMVGVGLGLYFRMADRERHNNIGRHVFRDGPLEDAAVPAPAPAPAAG